jgi:hypothetical protein
MLSVIFIPNVKADNNYYELDLRKFVREEEPTSTDRQAINFLDYKEVLTIYENVKENKNEVTLLHNEKALLHGIFSGEKPSYTIPEGVTSADNFKYDFTEEDKALMQLQILKDTVDNEPVQNPPEESAPAAPIVYKLSGYDGISVIVDKDCEKNTVCVLDTLLQEKSDAAIFRGSSNQRIIDVQKSLEDNQVCLVEKYIVKEKNESFKFGHEQYLFV